MPFTALNVVHIAHDNEYPGHLLHVSWGDQQLIFKATYSEAQPSHKAVILFENIVMCTAASLVVASLTKSRHYLLAYPRECA
jgi:hypothetical protein